MNSPRLKPRLLLKPLMYGLKPVPLNPYPSNGPTTNNQNWNCSPGQSPAETVKEPRGERREKQGVSHELPGWTGPARCGTALMAAQQLGRQWMGIDISPTACRVMAKRTGRGAASGTT